MAIKIELCSLLTVAFYLPHAIAMTLLFFILFFPFLTRLLKEIFIYIKATPQKIVKHICIKCTREVIH